MRELRPDSAYRRVTYQTFWLALAAMLKSSRAMPARLLRKDRTSGTPTGEK